jgi:DegV family protein with EDD domain
MRPAVRYLDAVRLQRGLAAGLKSLVAERHYLNRINVFPVPDGDTGNNLAQTASAALGALAARSHDNIRELTTAVADAALDGAQGNSGVILAQFFQGLADNFADGARVNTREFSDALTAAAAYTRTALENPREGTILTVIDATAAAAREAATEDFSELLPLLRTRALTALNETRNQLEELRRAGVVDAGAHGFFSILDACVDYLFEGSIDAPLVAAEIPDDSGFAELHPDLQDLTYRYCTECLVNGSALDIAGMRELLHPYGNSLVIAGSRKRMRIHIHSNDPEAVFEAVSKQGEVTKTKADDMIGQARTLHRLDRASAIVTDSAADIPEEILSELDIHMVPLRVQFGNESFLDKTGISPAEFRAELRTNPDRPGTSQPTQGDLRRMFEFLGTHFEQVTSINLGAELSGTYQGAVSAAARTEASEKITVIDSSNVSVGQGLLVAFAARTAASGIHGQALHDRIVAEKARIRTFALVTDLTNAVRSGRVKPALKTLADWLRITPVLTNTRSGKVGVSGYLPGRFDLVRRFAKLIARDLDGNCEWEIAIARDKEQSDKAEQLIAELSKSHPYVNVAWQTEIGPAFGVHAGMNALVVAVRQIARA